MEEHTNDEIPNEPFEVFEKMDGSLGILFNYNKEWILEPKVLLLLTKRLKVWRYSKNIDIIGC